MFTVINFVDFPVHSLLALFFFLLYPITRSLWFISFSNPFVWHSSKNASKKYVHSYRRGQSFHFPNTLALTSIIQMYHKMFFFSSECVKKCVHVEKCTYIYRRKSNSFGLVGFVLFYIFLFLLIQLYALCAKAMSIYRAASFSVDQHIFLDRTLFSVTHNFLFIGWPAIYHRPK